MANSGKLALKLIVDKEKNRVVIAESDNDFIDILLSFVTLPLGTIIRLVGKKSSPLGCFSKLYESIEGLDDKFLMTEACKNMLLHPRSAYEVQCEDLKIKVDDLNPRRVYICPVSRCFNRKMIYSLVTGARCHCGETMNKDQEWGRMPSEQGVFVKGGSKSFLVTDDFQVMTASSAHSLFVFKKLGIKDLTILEETDVEVGREEVMSLLERSLRSKTPLSDVLLKKVRVDALKVLKGIEMVRSTFEPLTTNSLNRIELKLLVNKDDHQVLLAEANADFINLLFSFLVFPLGSIVRLLHGSSSLRCVDNLYGSVQTLSGRNDDFLKSEVSKTMLLNPKLATHFGCSNQIVKIDESPPYPRVGNLVTSALNPKLPNSGIKGGGGFVKEKLKFMVTKDMAVKLMSPLTSFNLINSLNVPITSLEEKIVFLGEAEVLSILKAALIFDNALTEAFRTKEKEEAWLNFIR